MKKSILVIKDEKGLSIHPEEGFITENTVIPVKDSKELMLGLFGLLNIGDECIVIRRKRRKA